jgi:uncharacterized RDD family membrane protein YckC
LIQICKNCGAVNSEAVARCCFCDEPFAGAHGTPAARAAAAGAQPSAISPSELPVSTEGNLAVQPANWRHELANRVEAYRERRRQLFPDDFPVDLPFHEEEEPETEDSREEPRHAPLFSPEAVEPQMDRSLPLRAPRANGVERMEIAVSQPELNFGRPEAVPSAALEEAGEVIPVAPLDERRRAGLLDALFLALAYGAFLAMFRVFGGRLVLEKLDAVLAGTILVLFYAQYFGLFTTLGGETPGMKLRGLRVVSFDGSDPTPRQLLWRSFGYLISGGTALLGFLWAQWDEDHLTWHDRISQTYLTTAEPANESEGERSSGEHD